jgi:hypothetical protein
MSATQSDSRYSPIPVLKVLECFLQGTHDWRWLAEEVMNLWQGMAMEEHEEQRRRPLLTPGTLERMGLNADADPDPLTNTESAVRDVLAQLDEDVRWFLGDAESEEDGDDAFMKEEFRKIAIHARDRLQTIAH